MGDQNHSVLVLTNVRQSGAPLPGKGQAHLLGTILRKVIFLSGAHIVPRRHRRGSRSVSVVAIHVLVSKFWRTWRLGDRRRERGTTKLVVKNALGEVERFRAKVARDPITWAAEDQVVLIHGSRLGHRAAVEGRGHGHLGRLRL